MTSPEYLVLQAPAKINLCLKILGQRADGYHDLFSLVQAVSLYDTLTLSRIESGIEIECDLPDVPTGPDNIVWKAIDRLREKTNFNGGVKVTLVKRIPMGAGLGGGSSDAAAALKGVNSLNKLGLTGIELHSLSSSIGSDIPFFFSRGSAIVTGRGEKVENINLDRSYYVVLVVPKLSISTAEAYGRLRFCLTKYSTIPNFDWENSGAELIALLKGVGNDFQEMTVRDAPEIVTCMKLLQEAGAGMVSLTGSGSAFYGLFRSKPTADLTVQIRNRFGWQVHNLVPVELLQQ